MAFRYLDKIASSERLQAFLELADLAAGAGADANNVFLLSHRLREANPIQVCRSLLQRDSASQALIRDRRLCGPYNAEALKSLPKGALGHTYATVLETLGFDINFSLDLSSTRVWNRMLITSTIASMPPMTSITLAWPSPI